MFIKFLKSCRVSHYLHLVCVHFDMENFCIWPSNLIGYSQGFLLGKVSWKEWFLLFIAECEGRINRGSAYIRGKEMLVSDWQK